MASGLGDSVSMRERFAWWANEERNYEIEVGRLQRPVSLSRQGHPTIAHHFQWWDPAPDQIKSRQGRQTPRIPRKKTTTLRPSE